MKMQLRFKTLMICVAALGLVAPASASAANASLFAGAPASAAAAALRASMAVSGAGLSRTITIDERVARTNSRISAYDVDMEKRMHLIVVSDDLKRFMHIHPVLDANGRFEITTTFPGPGLYHLYADADPHGRGQSVFRFDVPIDASAKTSAERRLSPIGVAALGDYVVRISTDEVKAGADTPVLISIMKDGEPASDLHPYLGAYAHIVAIGVRDLSYTHIHAMPMSAMSTMSSDDGPPMSANASVPATMPVHIALPQPGIYKVWVQFVGGSRLYAAPLVLSAN